MSDVATHLEVIRHAPTDDGGDLPIVAVHGATSTATDVIAALRPVTDPLRRTVLAPAFHGPAHRGFQRLALPGDLWGAATALERALSDLGTAQVDLVGVSGGAQFAHRFALLHPDRVRRMALIGAGWYTPLDDRRPFPYGTADVLVERAAFLSIPTLLLVGERDVSRGALLRTGHGIDVQQGAHRLARAVWWSQHIAQQASSIGLPPAIRLELMRDVGHTLGPAVTTGELQLRLGRFLDQRGH